MMNCNFVSPELLGALAVCLFAELSYFIYIIGSAALQPLHTNDIDCIHCIGSNIASDVTTASCELRWFSF